ncbi:MAG: S1 RNA-binding domain-containing protein [Candidatus Aenigmarchaeota archaeon]|nr:S1 RNA-binding domain-containing protein [Candidatus Aenigmarchaeota archaeon]
MEDEKIRQIVVPGEEIKTGKDLKSGHGTYEENNKIYSKFLGIPQEFGSFISVIPLSGPYLPKVGDKVIGIVTDVEKAGWIVDIKCPWQAFLPLSEAVDEFIDIKKVNLNRYFEPDDIIYSEVIDTRRGDVHLTMRSQMSRKLKEGVIVEITPSKVPRLIGKDGSMINMIKDKTKTTIRVGQNGIVWISGEDIDKAIKAIKLIEEKSHIYGLTNEIEKLLS